MYDDALKSTRNIHRLLLAAGAVALVFVLSLQDASKERDLLGSLERLQEIPFSAYPTFVEERIQSALGDSIETRASELRESLDRSFSAAGLQVFGSDQLAQILAESVHVGRVTTEDLVTSQLGTATIDRLDRVVNDLLVRRDAEVVLADVPSTFADRISEILQDRVPAIGQLGLKTLRLEGVQLQPTADEFGLGQSFLSDREGGVPLSLRFEVHGGPRPIPVVEAEVAGIRKTVPNSSLIAWLNERDVGPESERPLVGSATSEDLRWLPEHDLSPAERRLTLSAWTEQLAGQIEDATAANRTIELPGLSVPGSLALFAIPIALLGLLASLLQHVTHLIRLAPTHLDKLAEFAWAPLAVGRIWWLEIAGTAIVLPVLVHSLLAWRADAFALPRLVVLLTAALGIVLSALLGLKLLLQLRRLRGAMPDAMARQITPPAARAPDRGPANS